MSATTAPLSDVFALLIDRLRASKAGHFVAPRPAELAPRRRRSESPPATDHRQLYHTLPTRWGLDEGGYVPCPTPSPPEAPVIRTPDEHRRNEAPASSRIDSSGSFRLFD